MCVILTRPIAELALYGKGGLDLVRTNIGLFVAVLSLYRIEPGACRDGERSADYLWSSYRSNGLGAPANLLTPHAEYLALANSAPQRMENYLACFVFILMTY